MLVCHQAPLNSLGLGILVHLILKLWLFYCPIYPANKNRPVLLRTK